ncbi:hypothetical protein [Nocardia sp. NPDC004415]
MTKQYDTRWHYDVPHIDRVYWPVFTIHSVEYVGEMWRYGPELLADITKDAEYKEMVFDALEYIISRATSREEWFNRTQIWFQRQGDLDEYLRAFLEYLRGDRIEPIYLPDEDDIPEVVESDSDI